MTSTAPRPRVGALLLAGAISVLIPNGCGKLKTAFGGGPLPAVAPLPAPKMPSWIAQASPTGRDISTLAQIRIIFKTALIPVEAIESPDEQTKLKSFELEPALPGQFRFLTPRMVGFQADKALPKATRVRVTLKAGLEDLQHHRLSQDIAWTFTTSPVKITSLPGVSSSDESEGSQSPAPTDLNPKLTVTANTELDVPSLEDHAALVSAKTHASVAIRAALSQAPSPLPWSDQTEDQPQNTFDESTHAWIYQITPRQTLDRATRYSLVISPGVLPAHGNLPSTETFRGFIDTYAPLAFERVTMVNVPDAAGPTARFAAGEATLAFNNPLDGASIQPNLTIAPAVKDMAALIQFSDGDAAIGLNPQLLDPDTTYTLTIGAGLKDKFGQTLGQARTETYDTGDVAPDLWAPGGLNIFPAGADLRLDVSAVNLPSRTFDADFRIVQPADLVYIDSADPEAAGYDVVAPRSDWTSYPLSQPKNRTAFAHVKLRERLGGATGMLAYGVSAQTYRYEENGSMKWRVPTYYGLAQLTNLGIFAQWFPTSGLVRIHHLSDGSPVAGAHVDVYPSRLGSKSRPAVSPCASGATDATGTLRFSELAIGPCIATRQLDSGAPTLLAIATEGRDWAYVRTDEFSGAYGYGVYGGWPAAVPETRGTVFSDRQLYQPGEKGWFTVEAYYLDGDTIAQDRGARYAVTLESPDGSKSSLGPHVTNEFGTFSFPIAFKSNQALGYYTIHAKNARGVDVTGQFQVAEFKPPNFKVVLALDKTLAVMGDTVSAKGSSTYLFGSPVEGGRASFYVTRQQTAFAPKGWDEFTFGRQWYWPEQVPSVSSDVLQTKTTLGSDGSSSQAVKIADDLPYPMTYRVDLQTTDVSNLSVSDSKTFDALPSDRNIGLRSDWVGEAGKPLSVGVIVTDPTGAAKAGERVRVELQSMDYSQATQVIAGGEEQRDQIKYSTVGLADVSSAQQPQTITLTAPRAGPYRIRANFADARSDVTASDTQVWVTGPQPVNWGSENPSQLQVRLDKSSYKLGDIASALVQSPYASGELYFAVVRHGTMYRSISHVRGGAPRIKFRITHDMLPNAAVEVVLVRQGEPLSKLQPGSLDSLSRIGFATFRVDLRSKRLKIAIVPAKAKAAPGSRQTIDFTLGAADGSPVRGQLTVTVVNEAILQLTGYRLPDLVDMVYAEQPIDTRFGDNRPNVVLAPIPSPVQKGWGYGGGFLPGAANTRVRKNFQPLAYFGAAVATDAAGHARVSFDLPDDLTTWRVLAVATAASSPGDDLRFGNGDATFITTKPLITNPVLPQFARSGDTFEGGFEVTNNTGQGGTLSILGSSAGFSEVVNGQMVTGGLRFDEDGRPTDTVRSNTSAPGTATQAYRFPMVAGLSGLSSVRFDTHLGSALDAFEVPFTVVQPPVTESVVDTGATASGASVSLRVNQSISNDVGGLHVAVAGSILPDITMPARTELSADQLPLLEPLASRLRVVGDTKILLEAQAPPARDAQATKLFKERVDFLGSLAAAIIADILKLQRADGGFSAWPGAKTTDRFVTPYAVRSLARARGAGLPVDSAMLTRVRAYLEHLLADPGAGNFCSSRWCKNYLRLQALIALSDLGETRNDFLSDIYDGRDDFDTVTQLQLAGYLLKLPGWRPQADGMAAKIERSLYQTGRYATINYPEEWGWLASPAAARAETIRLFLARHAATDILDKLVNSLLALRNNGRWGDSYDTAFALDALVDYLRAQPAPPNFSARVTLAGNPLLQAHFSGYAHSIANADIPASLLPRGDSIIALQKTGQGQLHYVVEYSYLLPGSQAGALRGIRIIREIRAVNQDNIVGWMGIAPLAKPLTLGAGQVWDIGLQVITDHPIDHVVVTDPLPAGLEAVDTSFQTSTPYFQARGDSWEIDYQQIYRDKVVAFANRLEAGVYDIHYLARSVTPGTFAWPGAFAWLQYAPEEFGRTASSTVVISQ